MSGLRYAVHVSPMIALAPESGIVPPDGAPALWSPLSTTLVYGPGEALLVDPPITRDQGAAVAAWAAGFDRPVSLIYVTHAHGDHWFGAAAIRERFPDARVVATPDVVGAMHRLTPGGVRAPFWDAMFPGLIGPTPVVAAPVTGELTMDGEPVVPIPVGHSDTEPATVLHVPSLDLVVAGDVIYDHVHQYLAESAGGGIERWQAAVDTVAALAPEHVVAGHRDPARDDAPTAIDDTRRYLAAAAGLFDRDPTGREYYDAIVARFPEWLNPAIAWLSALRRLGA